MLFVGAREPLGHLAAPSDPLGQCPWWAFLGYGPGTKELPIRFILSRFYVSICIGVNENRSGDSRICAYGGARPRKVFLNSPPLL